MVCVCLCVYLCFCVVVDKDAKDGGGEAKAPLGRAFRPLYDIPFMFEAREFLRKRLIGKKVCF
jgi:hypothetical protein